ncbi:hypothetical protein [Brevibacillus laterosporus]|uniref:Uncharacterized protein n=1 Tax=Brevibacillus laterosporus TaxID=1465 RepID=A0AAP3DGJ2_BRELA|nr:hypothetical protein [Brevibacillus laterosporus]MCR8980904.1 hypothetical protein [Brevibacillus laterosporus]MCZ0808059.1 hypothetical protein [Brevibacillus laterosporus]MCZ0826251.1 hypothetical protein [Brevibacillus laterosporus]MCZ0850134.1 hypothetical protein [Brevibacillus laterosporus]
MDENKIKAVTKVTAENKLISWGDLENSGITWKEVETSTLFLNKFCDVFL